jgi:hypothetical protein
MGSERETEQLVTAEHKASVFEGEREVLRDVTVRLQEGQGGSETASWGGAFQLNHPRQPIDEGRSYELKLDDGRCGTITITEINPSPATIDPWVSFKGRSPLR